MKKKQIKDDNLHVKVTKDQNASIEKRAKEEGRSKSNYILWLVSQDIEAHKK